MGMGYILNLRGYFMGEINDIEGMKKDILEAVRQIGEEELVKDIFNHINIQFNPETKLAVLNDIEIDKLLVSSVSAIYFLMYVRHYKTGMDIADRYSLFCMSRNLIRMLLNRTHKGHARVEYLSEIAARASTITKVFNNQ